MPENSQYNGHQKASTLCSFSSDFQNRLIEAIEGMREDYKDHYQKMVDRATDRADNTGMIPIKSHYAILLGSLVILLGVAVVKEFWIKS